MPFVHCRSIVPQQVTVIGVAHDTRETPRTNCDYNLRLAVVVHIPGSYKSVQIINLFGCEQFLACLAIERLEHAVT